MAECGVDDISPKQGVRDVDELKDTHQADSLYCHFYFLFLFFLLFSHSRDIGQESPAILIHIYVITTLQNILHCSREHITLVTEMEASQLW